LLVLFEGRAIGKRRRRMMMRKEWLERERVRWRPLIGSSLGDEA